MEVNEDGIMILEFHRGYEFETRHEKRMCANELKLKDPEDWGDEEWEIFFHWRNAFHSKDIISGPDSEEISRRKQILGEESEAWLKDRFK